MILSQNITYSHCAPPILVFDANLHGGPKMHVIKWGMELSS